MPQFVELGVAFAPAPLLLSSISVVLTKLILIFVLVKVQLTVKQLDALKWLIYSTMFAGQCVAMSSGVSVDDKTISSISLSAEHTHVETYRFGRIYQWGFSEELVEDLVCLVQPNQLKIETDKCTRDFQEFALLKIEAATGITTEHLKQIQQDDRAFVYLSDNEMSPDQFEQWSLSSDTFLTTIESWEANLASLTLCHSKFEYNKLNFNASFCLDLNEDAFEDFTQILQDNALFISGTNERYHFSYHYLLAERKFKLVAKTTNWYQPMVEELPPTCWQVAAFSKLKYAESFREAMPANFTIDVAESFKNGVSLYRVIVGPIEKGSQQKTFKSAYPNAVEQKCTGVQVSISDWH